VGTLHWITTSQSQSGGIFGAAIAPVDLNLPVGAVLKRVQIRNCFLYGQDTGIGWQYGGYAFWHGAVTFIAGATSRSIQTQTGLIQSSVTALYDVITAQRVYTVFWGGADHEMGMNFGCSYGKFSDLVPHTVRYTPGLTPPPSLPPLTMNGYWQYTFAALYEIA
jgi:hypothetical protein